MSTETRPENLYERLQSTLATHEFERGAPIDEVLEQASNIGMDITKAEQEIEKLRRKGKVYEPTQGHLCTAE